MIECGWAVGRKHSTTPAQVYIWIIALQRVRLWFDLGHWERIYIRKSRDQSNPARYALKLLCFVLQEFSGSLTIKNLIETILTDTHIDFLPPKNFGMLALFASFKAKCGRNELKCPRIPFYVNFLSGRLHFIKKGQKRCTLLSIQFHGSMILSFFSLCSR